MTPELEHEYLSFVDILGRQRGEANSGNDPHTQEMSFCLLHMVSGMCTESGEVVELIWEHIHYGNTLNRMKIKDELGDLFFYLCGAIIDIGTSIQELLDAIDGPLFLSVAGFVRGGSCCLRINNSYYNVNVGDVSPRLLDATMSLVIATSHMVDLLKKHMTYNRKLDFGKIKRELGSTLVHLAYACMEIGTNFDEIVAMNMAKLRKRYPNGYTHTNANNRNRKAEDESQQKAVERITNVDGESVVKGSEKDDRWGPYGTKTNKKPINVQNNPPGENYDMGHKPNNAKTCGQCGQFIDCLNAVRTDPAGPCFTDPQ